MARCGFCEVEEPNYPTGDCPSYVRKVNDSEAACQRRAEALAHIHEEREHNVVGFRGVFDLNLVLRVDVCPEALDPYGRKERVRELHHVQRCARNFGQQVSVCVCYGLLAGNFLDPVQVNQIGKQKHGIEAMMRGIQFP